MKIQHIIDSGGLYGAEIMLLNLMSEQTAMGLEPVLVSIGDSGAGEKPIEKEARLRGFRVAAFRMKPGPDFSGALRVLRFAKQERADILHSHGYKGNILFGFLPRCIRRLPLVSTVHGWTWSGGMTRMLLYEWLDSISLSFVDRVIMVNAVMKDHPRLRNKRGLALDVVPNGIPLNAGTHRNDTAGLNQEITEFCRHGYTIGAIGRLSPEKGFDSLLEAFATLHAKGIDIRLVILGEGGLRNNLEDAARRLGIERVVLMPGYVEDAKRYLPLFNLFAISSLTEGLPIVLLEAMQAAVPVVATRVGGIPEVLQEGRCGLLIEAGNPEALEQAIAEAMHNPQEAAQRADAARQRVIEEYSSRAMAEKYLAIYRSVLP